MKCSGIGGQAVIEGVMMKNKEEYAVAVRKTDGEIEIQLQSCKRSRGRYMVDEIPVIRGIVAFVESLRMGMKTLNYSASLFEEEEEKEKSEKDGKKDSILMGLTMVFAVMVAIGIFVIFPFFVSESLRKVIRSSEIRGLIEGVIRVVLFIIYVKLISLVKDINRVFMYHGAEHKTINCIENGYDLTVENVRKQSTQHKRCGTSFLFVVMFVSILFFMIINVRQMWLRMVYRILLIPLIAGVAYEFIRYAGSHDNVISNVLSKPGLWLQGLTTAEPDDSIIEVAIASVDAVFNWKSFVEHVRESEEKEGKEKKDKEKLSKKESEDGTEVLQKKAVDRTVWREDKEEKTEKASEAETTEEAGKAAETAAAEDTGIEILTIDDEDEEDDAILNALDRYFEAPK